ncbi:MAG: hypothetical protein WCR06_10620 [bacterium]
MDISTGDTLKPFVPAWGSADEWNEAYEKVENYLRAGRINSRLHRARLIHRILQRVAEQGPVANETALSAMAIRETQVMMKAWFARMMQPAAEGGHFSLVDGRVALLLCDGPDRWPYAFLTTDDLPPDFVKEMRESMLVAGPNLEISNMVPREIDYGWFPEIAGDTLDSLNRRPFLQALVAWALFVLLLVYLFYKTR